MDNNTPAEEIANDKKIIRARSAKNPGALITQSIDFVKQIHKIHSSFESLIKLDDIEGIVPSGNLGRDLAAAAEYGLLEKLTGEGYKKTPLFKKINNPIGNDLAEAKLEAFKSPKLYQALIERFSGSEIHPDLPAILVRFHGIAENASKEVAERFIENAKEVGALNDAGVFQVPGWVDVPYFGEPVEEIKKDSSNGKLQPNANNKPETPAIPLSEINNSETAIIKLKENRIISTTYPKSLDKSDIKTWRTWLDYIESTLP